MTKLCYIHFGNDNITYWGGMIMVVLVFLYIALGYWATGKTIYANKILIGTGSSIAIQRMTMGFVLGWILIPIALIKLLLFR